MQRLVYLRAKLRLFFYNNCTMDRVFIWKNQIYTPFVYRSLSDEDD